MDYYFRKCEFNEFKYPIPLFALGYYKLLEEGKDEFSRNTLHYYKYGAYPEYVISRFNELSDNYFKDDINWDVITIIPTHKKNDFNANMKKLAELFSNRICGQYKALFQRMKTTEEFHSRLSVDERMSILNETISYCENMTDKNILILDNTSFSGCSLLHCGNLVLEDGAKNVAGICLSMGKYNSRNPSINEETDIKLDPKYKASYYISL